MSGPDDDREGEAIEREEALASVDRFQAPPGWQHRLVETEISTGPPAWSTDGERIAAHHQDGITVWEAESATVVGQLAVTSADYPEEEEEEDEDKDEDEDEQERDACVSFSPDGRHLASWAYSSSVHVWDTGAWTHGITLTASGDVPDVAWSPTGNQIALCGGWSVAPFITVFDVGTGERLRELRGHNAYVFGLAWDEGTDRLASASWDSTVRVWSGEGDEEQVLAGHGAHVHTVAWSPDAPLLASGGDDMRVIIWDLDGQEPDVYLEGHTARIRHVDFDSTGRILASQSATGEILLWRTSDWTLVGRIDASADFTRARCALHPREMRIASVSTKPPGIQVWQRDLLALQTGVGPATTVPYVTARMALVGNSGVGKSSLGWRLAHGVFREMPSTHGQQFWLLRALSGRRDDGVQLEAILWDFAGQPDYRLVHALFLDAIDVAIVMFDPTNPTDPLAGVDYWVEQLRRDAEFPIVLVASRVDRGAPTVTDADLFELCRRKGVHPDVVRTSALEGTGVDELVELLGRKIPWDAMPPIVTTEAFKLVKDLVLELKTAPESGAVLLTADELSARLTERAPGTTVTPSEIRTAIEHLAKYGYSLSLRTSSGEDLFLLAPDVLINLAASMVLRAREEPKGLGFLEEGRLIAGGYFLPEIKDMPFETGMTLVDAAVSLFLRRNVCFRETLGPNTLLVFPSLINQKRPPDELDLVEGTSYIVTGAVEQVYAALVVRLGYTNTFSRTEQWQGAAEYEMAEGERCGFRLLDEQRGRLELVLYYGPATPDHVRQHFESLFELFLAGRRGITTSRYPRVVCGQCRYEAPRSEVIRRLGEGRTFLFCADCGHRVELGFVTILGKPAAGGDLRSAEQQAESRTAFEAALSRLKGYLRDRRTADEPVACFVSYAWGDAEIEARAERIARDLRGAGVDVILDRWDNSHIGSSVGRFISKVESSEFVLVCGSPLYRRKYENRDETTGTVVAAEVDLINVRMTGTEAEKATVLPVLLDGSEATSLPPLLRGRVYGDFRGETKYYNALFGVLLTLFGVPPGEDTIDEAHRTLRRARVFG